MKQAATAIAVYRHDIEPSLESRQKFVRGFLRLYLERYGQAPTSLELVKFIEQELPGQWIDVNTVRPRCTEMEAAGWLRHGAKRRCFYSNKTVFTWELSEPAPVVPLPEPLPQRLF